MRLQLARDDVNPNTPDKYGETPLEIAGSFRRGDADLHIWKRLALRVNNLSGDNPIG